MQTYLKNKVRSRWNFVEKIGILYSNAFASFSSRIINFPLLWFILWCILWCHCYYLLQSIKASWGRVSIYNCNCNLKLFIHLHIYDSNLYASCKRDMWFTIIASHQMNIYIFLRKLCEMLWVDILKCSEIVIRHLVWKWE